ncbi:MAG: hypothetical protein CME65_11665 [Halobacteriovoraceae bacterium]|nr:hypothetical protein [Halobacteriovoraceae bacterium]|tara:strand:+ start:12340 stop:12699 length:360 start_codon:yes stop_codon:yes gene_type:complete
MLKTNLISFNLTGNFNKYCPRTCLATIIPAMARECTICKHYGKKSPDENELERATIFDEVGTAVPIILCRPHSVELFKSGQKKFMVNHYKILVDLISSDETKFLEILEKTVKSNLSDIY